MADNQPQTNGNIFQFLLDFDPTLLKHYNKLTGREMKIEKVGENQNPDGTTTPLWAAVEQKSENHLAMINDKGAKFIIHELDYYYNPQNAMAELKEDDVVEVAADAIDSIFDEIFLNTQMYEIKNPSRLHAEETNMLNGLYIWLSAIKDGKLANWGRDVISIKQSDIQQNAQSQTDMGLLGNLNAKLR